MTPRTRKPRQAAIYARISRDRNGEQLGVQRQRKECTAWAADHGWSVAEIYSDDDISAYNLAYRPGYRRMLTDLAEGRRDGLIAWHNDRLTRHPKELEDLVEVVEASGVPIGTVTAGDFDLSNASGRGIARILGNIARMESEHKAERIEAKHRELAEAGKVSGGGNRPFGYQAGGTEIEPAEAALITEAAERVLAGEGLMTIVNDWNRRGVRTVTGAPHWRAISVKRILTSARISGQREHHNRIVGKAAWPAIVDAKTTSRLRAVLLDPSRGRGHTGQYLLAGLVRCGACGKTLRSRPGLKSGRRPRRYACTADTGGCAGVGIVADPTEEIVVEAVLTRLDSPALRRELTRRKKPRNGSERHLRTLEAKETELAELWAAGELTRAAWSAARDRLAREIEETRAKVAGRVTEDAAADLVGQGASLRKQWDGDDLSIERKRAIVAAVVEAVTIAPTTVNRFDPSRISVLWRA